MAPRGAGEYASGRGHQIIEKRLAIVRNMTLGKNGRSQNGLLEWENWSLFLSTSVSS
jgi:hypothetical protein